ncbi:2'-5' RNA ligase family protein [Scrofimicrobium sp. R131]|uniref:2'-5' RNA ligase family protein n=1 Tax=Scrofimicrobium appendicitidis TaxID=3079930 RepID=A0AAU7V8F7_9ACTO
MYLPPKTDDQEWLGVLIAIPEPWVTELTAARRELGDPAADCVPAHLTLIPPTPVNVDEREDVFRHLQHVASHFGPFRLSLSGTGTFLPTSPVVFLDVTEGADACMSLADELRSGPLDHQARFPYHPHVTLAHGLPEESLHRARAGWADFEASWMVPGFRLDSVDPNGRYNTRALFDFAL